MDRIGETVEVTLEFSEAVVVGTNGGIPSVTLALTRRADAKS